MKKLAILGASGHGKVIAELSEILGYQAFFFDDDFENKKIIEHWEIQGTLEDLLSDLKEYQNVAVAIGNNAIRQFKCQQLIAAGAKFPSLIHPSAVVSQHAVVGNGTVILSNAVVNSFAKIGQGVIVNSASVIEHDCVIDDFAHICPRAALAGGVYVGKRTWIGIGACVRQLIKIEKDVEVGAGSVVVKDISIGDKVYGVPAKSRG